MGHTGWASVTIWIWWIVSLETASSEKSGVLYRTIIHIEFPGKKTYKELRENEKMPVIAAYNFIVNLLEVTTVCLLLIM